MRQRLFRFMARLTMAAIIAAVATASLDWTWRLIGGGELPMHGWIALLIGCFGTVGLAWGLMALAFKSHREGWDERVDNTLDPGRERNGEDRG